jgi:5-formyltetrahydrofolate cyclo-ligase
MQSSIAEAKASLRQEVRAALDRLGAEERRLASERARTLLERQPQWIKAERIVFFAPMPDEVDLWPLAGSALAAGKQVALPRFTKERNGYIACRVHNLEQDLQIGRYGIREPLDRCGELQLNRLDLMLVPGVAFDLRGRRLGRGKGFYDQLLAVEWRSINKSCARSRSSRMTYT